MFLRLDSGFNDCVSEILFYAVVETKNHAIRGLKVRTFAPFLFFFFFVGPVKTTQKLSEILSEAKKEKN